MKDLPDSLRPTPMDRSPAGQKAVAMALLANSPADAAYVVLVMQPGDSVEMAGRHDRSALRLFAATVLALLRARSVTVGDIKTAREARLATQELGIDAISVAGGTWDEDTGLDGGAPNGGAT